MDKDLGTKSSTESSEGNSNADIYGDLPDFRYDVTLDQLQASVAKLEAENYALQSRLAKVSEEKKSLDLNYSALFKTAKLEIQRKERTISELRERLNLLRKTQPCSKRKRAVRATPSPRKRPKLCSERIQAKIHTPLVENRTRSSKPKVLDQNERSSHVRTARCDHEVFEKENAPQKGPSDEELPLVKGNHAAPCVVMGGPSTDRAAPALPAIKCPTLFSDRMYKRIYGFSPAKVHNKSTSSEKIEATVVNQRPESPETPGRVRTTPLNSSGQRSSSDLCLRITPEDIRAYLGGEAPSDSDSSSCSSTQLCQYSSSDAKPQTQRDPNSPIEAVVGLIHEPPVKKLEVPLHQTPAVEPLPTPSVYMSPKVGTLEVTHAKPNKSAEPLHQPVPAEETKECSPKVNAPRSTAKSPVANLLLSGKPRRQTVATIRPIQKVAAQGILVMPERSDSVVTPDRNASVENLPESERTEIGVGSVEKPTRNLKIPGLPGSAKGRTIRQVFAPISNQWSCSLNDNKKGSDRKGCSELSVVQTVSVTSELTVRVEDSKLDGLRRHSLTEAVFGSPVKWADDSLDSPIAEGSANSQKTVFYSIFGSPLKSVDSNSSEHPFSVPPGAYEESCWTSQVPEKVQKSSPPDAQLQKQGSKSQEPVPLPETDLIEKSTEPNDAEKVGTISPVCPPPSSSVIKKHVSIFSPEKDDKISSNIPDDLSKSNTGIFFPFPKPKYEDSILGHFDDTAQFVSAVASNFRVNSEISPLSTPVKSGSPQSVIVKNNPTSFEEVFNKNALEAAQLNVEPTIHKTRTEITPILNKRSSNENDTQGTPIHSLLASNCSNESQESEKGNARPSCTKEDAKPPKTAAPPTITITSPNSQTFHYDESFRIIIHRPNLASSTKSFVVKSWFPKGTPAKWVTPRKTPRLVTRVSPTSAPKPSASIDYAIVFDQEGRVRSASGSPTKSANGSPTRKRLELPGKISPTKRSPKKPISPFKNTRQAELCRNLGTSVASSPVPRTDSHIKTSMHLLNPDSTNQPDRIQPRTQSPSLNANTCEAKITPGSLDSTTERVESQVKEKASIVDPSKSNVCSVSEYPVLKREVVPSEVPQLDSAKSCGLDVPINEVTPRKDTPSQLIALNPVPINDELGSKEDVSEGVLNLEIPGQDALFPPSTSLLSIDPSLGPIKNIPDDPVHMMNLRKDASFPLTKSVAVPIEDPTFMKDTKTCRKDSAKATVPSSSSSSKVTNTKLSQIDGRVQSLAEAKTRKKGESSKAKAIGSLPSKHTNSCERPADVPPSIDKVNGPPIVETVAKSSIYSSMIQRVKPSTPSNISVAALIKSSTHSTTSPSPRPRPVITRSNTQSTKRSNFKRSSALKPNAQKGGGNSLMNSIRSTFFRTNASKTEDSSKVQSPKTMLDLRKSARIVNVSPAREAVTSESSYHNPVITPAQKNSNLTTEKTVLEEAPTRARAKTAAQLELSGAADDASSLKDRASFRERAQSVGESLTRKSGKPVELEHSFPGKWKLLEVDRSTNSVSLLQRFRASKCSNALNNRSDLEGVKTSNTRTESTRSVEKCTSEQKYKSNEVDSIHILTTERAAERTFKETPVAKAIPDIDGAKKKSQYDTKHPKSVQRKTILLDAPLQMETPTKKTKRSEDSIKLPASKEESLHLESGGTSGARTSGGRLSETTAKPTVPDRPLAGERENADITSPEKPSKTRTKPGRSRTAGRRDSKEKTSERSSAKYGKTDGPCTDCREKLEETSPHNLYQRCAEPGRSRCAGRKDNVEKILEKCGKKYADPDRPRIDSRREVETTSPHNSDQRCGEPERPSDRRVNPVKTFKRPAQQERRRDELCRKSTRPDLRSLYFRRSRSVSIEVSSRRLRALKRDVTPKPRRKSRTAHRDSPQRSSIRKPEPPTKSRVQFETSSSDPVAHERSTRKSKLRDESDRKDKVPESSSSKSSVRRSKMIASESVDGKSKIDSPGTSELTSRIVSAESSGKLSNNGSSELKQANSFVSDPARSQQKIISESANDKAAHVQAPEVPQHQTPPWARSSKRKVTVIGTVTPNCDTPCFPEFNSSAEIASSTPRIQLDSTPRIPVVYRNRLLKNRSANFSNS